MLREAVAQGSGGAESAQGSERARDVARERFRRTPAGLANAADGRMRVPVVGRRARRGESPIEIIERGKRDGAKDRELQRPRRGFNLLERAAEANRWMRKEREKGAGRERDRRFKDEPRQHAGGALSQCPSSRIFDLYSPTRELDRDPARDRGVGRNEGRRLARGLERLAHRNRQRQSLFVLVVGDDDRDALKRSGQGQRRQSPSPLTPEIGRTRRAGAPRSGRRSAPQAEAWARQESRHRRA